MTARVIACWVLMAAACCRADEFDLYTNSVLDKVPSFDGAAQVEKLALAELYQAKPVIARENDCFLVVRTDEGNWAKLLVRQSFRKQPSGETPLVVVRRFQCMRPGTESGRLASGKDLYLFDGFQFNCDIGQIVPDEGGGDLVFRREGPSGGFLQPVGKARLYVIHKPLVSETAEAAGPSPGPVVPEDFAGRYRLVASGKWSGLLTLAVKKSGDVTGSYVSDQTGADYPVKGFVARPAHHIKFTVELPMARQEFDGYLWTQGKGAIAGSMTIANNQFGFVAVREGFELLPKSEP